MAEIGASRRIWPKAKHQLCWWHQREALRRRLKGNLPTSVYNAQRARREHPFIDVAFKPYGHVDPNDCEGSVPGEICEQDSAKAMPSGDPNAIKIRLPTLTNHSTQGREDITSAGDSVGGLTLGSGNLGLLEGPAFSVTGGLTLGGGRPDLLGVPAESPVAGVGDSAGGLPVGGGSPGLLGVPAESSVKGVGDGASGLTLGGSRLGSLGVTAECSVTDARNNTGGLTLTDSRSDPLRIRIPARDKGVRVAEPRAPTDNSKLTI